MSLTARSNPLPRPPHDPAQSLGRTRGRRRAVAFGIVVVGFALGSIWLAGRGGRSKDLSLNAFSAASVPAAKQVVETGGVSFAEVAQERGLLHVWPQQPRPMRSPEAFGCGCAAFDYDNDGWQDVLLVADPHARLYHNLGGSRFEEVTESVGLLSAQADWVTAAGLPASLRDWIGAAVGDYDGDGWLDLLLTGFHRLALFKNDGGKGFIDVTTQAGLDPANHEHWGASAGFMDLDGDEFLDLVILNYVVFGPDSKQYCELTTGVLSGCPPKEYPPEFGEIWRNTGQGSFAMVPAEDGMKDTNGVALVLAFTDVEDDLKQDFYIGNDGTKADFLDNLGGMRFKNKGIEIGLSVGREFRPMAAMGADWADFNRDGRLDLTVTDFQQNCFALFRHDVFQKANGEKSHSFQEVGNLTGISLTTCNRLGFGAKWIDMDNDGWPDICFVNGHVYDNAGDLKPGETLRQATMLFRNERGRRFVDLVPVLDKALGKPIVGRGSATADFDNDGRVDLLIVDYEGPVLLFENHSQTDNHWVKFDLRGEGTNTFAYGARVTARSGGENWIAEVSPASSYLSSSDPRIHFGLGSLTSLEKVEIRWPSGRVEELREVSADQIVRVVEGQATPAAP